MAKHEILEDSVSLQYDVGADIVWVLISYGSSPHCGEGWVRVHLCACQKGLALSSGDTARRYMPSANRMIAKECFSSKSRFSQHFHSFFIWHVGRAKSRWAAVLSSLLLLIVRRWFCHYLNFGHTEYICDLCTVSLLNCLSDLCLDLAAP